MILHSCGAPVVFRKQPIPKPDEPDRPIMLWLMVPVCPVCDRDVTEESELGGDDE